ncbi:MAG: beta-propeller fold lactonase family protein [Streptosporangiales bacterium]|nr:beta-propeller fold lactonase family protein [Streptosporangiales bacterium]
MNPTAADRAAVPMTPAGRSVVSQSRYRVAGAAVAGLLTAATLVLSGPATAVAGPERGLTSSDALPPGGRTVYVTNRGNVGGDANVTRFTINNSGTLARADSVDAGAGARGMVFTPDLRFAYLSSSSANQVEMYRIGPDGALTRFGAETPGGFSIAITPNGRTVYVSSPSDDTLSVFAVGPGGRLTPRGTVDTGAATPKGVAVTPDGRFLYVSHGGTEDTERTVITGFAIERDGSVGRRVAKAKIGISGAETVITPNGRFVYVVNQVSNDVYGFRIGDDGALTPVPGSPIDGGDFPEGAGISPDGRRLYVAAVGVEDDDVGFPGQVLGFTIGPDGRLAENIDRVDMTSPIGIGFTPDGRHLYVSDHSDSIVNTFAVAPDGNLRLIQTVKSGGSEPAFHSVNVLPERTQR